MKIKIKYILYILSLKSYYEILFLLLNIFIIIKFKIFIINIKYNY